MLTRFMPVLVLLTMFGCVIATVKFLRPPKADTGSPTVLVLSADRAEGVERRVFSVDSLFPFGSSALNPKSKVELADFAGKLRAAGVRQIVVIGHADRIGARLANEQLSLARARAVRGAMVKAGIGEDAITAVGMGNRVPATAPGECDDSAPTELRIACLSKDRRVEVWTKAGVSL